MLNTKLDNRGIFYESEMQEVWWNGTFVGHTVTYDDNTNYWMLPDIDRNNPKRDYGHGGSGTFGGTVVGIDPTIGAGGSGTIFKGKC